MLIEDLKFDLFYRYRFRQISRLVYIQILSERSIIGNQLQHDSDREYSEAVVYIRNADSDISQIVIPLQSLLLSAELQRLRGL